MSAAHITYINIFIYIILLLISVTDDHGLNITHEYVLLYLKFQYNVCMQSTVTTVTLQVCLPEIHVI